MRQKSQQFLSNFLLTGIIFTFHPRRGPHFFQFTIDFSLPRRYNIPRNMICGRSSMVEHQLPKLNTRVRFPSPAPKIGRRCKVSADFYFFTIHDSLFTAWQSRFLEGNHEERRVKGCGGGALRRNKGAVKTVGSPQEKPQTFPPEAVRLATNFLRLRARAQPFLSGLQFPYKIPAGEAQRDFPVVSGHRLKSRSASQRRDFLCPHE